MTRSSRPEVRAGGKELGRALLAALPLAAAALLGAGAPVGARAEASGAELQEIRREIAEQRREIRAQRRRIAEQERELEALEERLGASEGAAARDGAEGSGGAADRRGPVSPEPEPEAPREPVAPRTAESERPEPQRPLEQLLLEAGAILLPQGTLQLEPALEYTHSSNSRVAISGFTIFEAITIGTIEVDRLDRDILTSSFTARLGLHDRVQLEARVPWTYRRDDEILGVGTSDERDRTITGSGLGDVEAELLWQAWLGRGAVPNVILNLGGVFPTGESPFDIDREVVGSGGQTRLEEAPTGSGFYGVSPGATMVWRSDPAVFFLGGGYTFNLERDQGSEFGDIDPGDTIDGFVGMNVALSERVSLNLSFVDQYTFETEREGEEAPGTALNDGRLVLGASLGLTPRTSLLVSAAAGLTEQSPDFLFTARLPMNFSLF